MEQETEIDRVVAARLAAGVDRASIVRELSLNFDYVQCVLRAYVDGFIATEREPESEPEGEPVAHAPARSFRLTR